MKSLPEIVVECTSRLSQVLPEKFLPCRTLMSEVIWPAPDSHLHDFVRIYKRVLAHVPWKEYRGQFEASSNMTHCTTNHGYLSQEGKKDAQGGMGAPESHHPMRNGGVSAPESHARRWKEMACVPPRNGEIKNIPVPGPNKNGDEEDSEATAESRIFNLRHQVFKHLQGKLAGHLLKYLYEAQDLLNTLYKEKNDKG